MILEGTVSPSHKTTYVVFGVTAYVLNSEIIYCIGQIDDASIEPTLYRKKMPGPAQVPQTTKLCMKT